MAAVRITVGAASDGSMATVFQPMVTAARKARTAIEGNFKALANDMGIAFKAMVTDASKGFGAITDAEKKELAKQIDAVKAAEAEKRKYREEAMKAPGGGGGGHGGGPGRTSLRDDGYRTALGTTRYMNSALRGAGRVAGEIAQGAGVDLNLGSLVGKSVQMDKRATDLANAGWQPGAKGAAGTRVDEGTLKHEAMAAANKAGLDPEKAMEGMQKFVGLTGDLESARAMVGDLGVLARSTGTEFDVMVDAAGEVSAKLGDIPNKGAATLGVLRAMAGQGKLGALEIKSMAKEMAKVGAAAHSFNMTPDKAMQMMGVIMQEARQAGGAKSASIAANSAMALMTGLTKASTLKNLAAQGVQPWADPGKGAGHNTKLLPLDEIIKAALYKTGGNIGDLQKMFKDVNSMRAVRGFANVYNETKGSPTQKLDAVRAEFERLGKAAMGQGEVMDQFNKSMENPDAKIQLFNNKLTEIGESIAGKVLPAMEKLAPLVLQGVEAFGKLVAWAAGNPFSALSVMLAASFARASVDSVIRAGIESLFDKAKGGAGGVGAGAGGKLGGAITTAGQALAIVATAITIEQVGELVIDRVMKEREKKEDKGRGEVIDYDNAMTGARLSNDKSDAFDKLDVVAKQLQAKVDLGESASPLGTNVTSGIINYLTRGSAGSSFNEQGAQQDASKDLQDNKHALDMIHAEQARLTAAMGGVIRVEVVSGGGGLTDPRGTSSPGPWRQ